MSKFTTICLLMYGDYPELHKASLSGLLRSDLRHADVRIWCNVICPATFEFLLKAKPSGWWLYINTENRPKYKLMRDMIHDPDDGVKTPWVTWLDDDTLVLKPNWAVYTKEQLAENPKIDFCGKETSGRYYPGGYGVVKSSRWYTGARFGKGISRHVYGAYWWMKMETLRALNWPDPRLSHNGGDWLLSEAIRQQGYKQANITYGIKVQLNAKRRGLSEVSVGRRNNKHTSSSDGKAPTMVGRRDYYVTALERAGVEFEEFDSRTLLVKFPGKRAGARNAEEALRLAQLGEKVYPSALPKALFVEEGRRHTARRVAKAERHEAVVEERERKRSARKRREKRMAEKIKLTTPNAPKPTSPLPRINKTPAEEPKQPRQRVARKTIKQILTERRKK